MENYSLEMERGIPGSIADSKHVDANSKCVETGSATELVFGAPVKQGSKDSLVKHLEADTDKIHGLLKHKHNELGLINDLEAYSIIRKGRVFVEVSEAVVAGDAVFYDRATKKFNKTSGAELVGAEFALGGNAGSVASIDINLPR